MTKTLLIAGALTAAALLPGCGIWERTVAQYTGWSKVCVEGVVYLQFPSGVTVQHRPDGSIATCS